MTIKKREGDEHNYLDGDHDEARRRYQQRGSSQVHNGWVSSLNTPTLQEELSERRAKDAPSIRKWLVKELQNHNFVLPRSNDAQRYCSEPSMYKDGQEHIRILNKDLGQSCAPPAVDVQLPITLQTNIHPAALTSQDDSVLVVITGTSILALINPAPQKKLNGEFGRVSTPRQTWTYALCMSKLCPGITRRNLFFCSLRDVQVGRLPRVTESHVIAMIMNPESTTFNFQGWI